MALRIGSRVLAVAAAGWLLVGGSGVGTAAVVFDDHFTGNSGGIPAGWSLFSGPGTAVESGTTVTLDHDVILRSASTVDPSSGTLTLTAEIADLSFLNFSTGIGLADPTITHVLSIDFKPADLGASCQVMLGNDTANNGPGWTIYDRVTVGIVPPVGIENVSQGQVKALYRR